MTAPLCPGCTEQESCPVAASLVAVHICDGYDPTPEQLARDEEEARQQANEEDFYGRIP